MKLSTETERAHWLTFAAAQPLPLDAECKPWKPRRSDSQNAYLWGVCYPALLKCDALHGWDAKDLHDYFLGEHFGWERLEGFGRTRIKPLRRSSKLSKVEFGEFVDFIHRQAAGHGVYIPQPEGA